MWTYWIWWICHDLSLFASLTICHLVTQCATCTQGALIQPARLLVGDPHRQLWELLHQCHRQLELTQGAQFQTFEGWTEKLWKIDRIWPETKGCWETFGSLANARHSLRVSQTLLEKLALVRLCSLAQTAKRFAAFWFAQIVTYVYNLRWVEEGNLTVHRIAGLAVVA